MKDLISLIIGHFCLGFFIAACFIMPARLFMAMIGPAIGAGVIIFIIQFLFYVAMHFMSKAQDDE